MLAYISLISAALMIALGSLGLPYSPHPPGPAPPLPAPIPAARCQGSNKARRHGNRDVIKSLAPHPGPCCWGDSLLTGWRTFKPFARRNFTVRAAAWSGREQLHCLGLPETPGGLKQMASLRV